MEVKYFRCQFHQCFMCSFYAHRSQKSKKIQLGHWYLFTLLESASVKAIRRTLMKLSPDEDNPMLAELYNNLRASYEMIDKYPFILFSSQNCSDMIVAAGKVAFTHPVSACVFRIALKFFITYLD